MGRRGSVVAPAGGKLDRFRFLKEYRAVPGNNPLVSGKVDAETLQMSDGTDEPEQPERELLDLDLVDLVKAKMFFCQNDMEGSRPTDAAEGLLSTKVFVNKFANMCGEHTREQLHYLFMKIDCDLDGFVSWDEFLTYVTARSTSLAQPLSDEKLQKQLIRQPILEVARSALHKDFATHVVYVPVCSAYATAALDGSVRIWTKDLAHEHTIERSDKVVPVRSICVLPTLHKLVIATDDRQLLFYELLSHANATRWALLGRLLLKELPTSLAAWRAEGSDGMDERLAIGSESGLVQVCDARALVRAIRGQVIDETPLDAAIRSSKTIAAATVVQITLHRDWISHLDFHESMRALISAGQDGEIKLTALNPAPLTNALLAPGSSEWRHICTFHAHHKGVHRVVQANAGDKKLLASCGNERNAKLWNLEVEDLVRELAGHRTTIVDIAFDRSRHILFTLSNDGEVRTWDLSDLALGCPVIQVIIPESHVHDRPSAINFNERAQCLVAADKKVSMWFYRSRFDPLEVHAARAFAPKGHGNPLVGVLYSAQLYLVVSADVLGLICVWDVRSGALLFRFEHTCSTLTAMEFDSSGRRLLTGSSDGAIRLWNYSSGELLKTLSFDTNGQGDGPLSSMPDLESELVHDEISTPFASSTSSWSPMIRKARSPVNIGSGSVGDSSRELTKGTRPGPSKLGREIEAVLHIEQGATNLYVAVGWSRSVLLMPATESERQARTLNGHTDDILSLAFCPPNLLCTGAYDGTIIAWNIVSGILKFRLMPTLETSTERTSSQSASEGWAFSSAVESLCSLMRACILVSASADGTIRFWDALEAKLLQTVAGACDPGESLQHVSAEETNTLLFTGDSIGCIKVWDISDIVELSVQRRSISQAQIKLLFSWRAHLRAVVRVEYLKDIEGLISASTDCTVRLWTLSGEQIGVFGQVDAWELSKTSSWLDTAPASVMNTSPLMGAYGGRVTAQGKPSDDKTLATQSKLTTILPAILPDEATSRGFRASEDLSNGALKIKAELGTKARNQSREHATWLAEASAKALQPPAWRLNRSRPASLQLSTDWAELVRAQSVSRLIERRQVMLHAKVKATTAAIVEPQHPSPSLPRYVHGGARWVASSSTQSFPTPFKDEIMLTHHTRSCTTSSFRLRANLYEHSSRSKFGKSPFLADFHSGGTSRSPSQARD